MITYASGNPAHVEAYAVVERVTIRELLDLDAAHITVNPYPEEQAAYPYDHAYHERRDTDVLVEDAGEGEVEF